MLEALAAALAIDAQKLRQGLSSPLRQRLLDLQDRPDNPAGQFFGEEDWVDVCAQTQAWFAFALELSGLGGLDQQGLRWIIQQNGPLWKRILQQFDDPEWELARPSDRPLLAEGRERQRLLQGFAARGVDVTLSMLFESFLATFDSGRRRRSGAYFTPSAIARRLVHDVDAVLREEFSLERGLADDAVWADCVGDEAKRLAPSARGSFIRILDPAAGSGVFLVAAIEQIHGTITAVWGDQGCSDDEIGRRWNAFVPSSLLPRLFGLELSPAACFAAHLEIAQTLAKTGYKFGSPAVVQVFTVNTLAEEDDGYTTNAPVTVILGNPPFAALSQNRSSWIAGLLKGKDLGDKAASYFEVDGKPLGERKHWLHDDYVKFLRYAQWRIENAGCGVVGLVTNHSYLDNPTFRGLRWQLMQSFSRIDVIDLHGNRKKRETAPGGQRDENVFQIDQGVALSVLCRGQLTAKTSSVRRADLWGTRAEKWNALAANEPELPFVSLAPSAPFYFFTVRDDSLREEYERGWPLSQVMPVFVAAPVTARDKLVVAFTREELHARLTQFRDLSLPDKVIRERYFAPARTIRYPRGDTRGWKLSQVRRRLAAREDWESAIRPCLYRPFDRRWIYWSEMLVDWPRRSVMRHLEAPGNLAIIARRQMPPSEPARYFWVTEEIPLDGVIRSDNRGGEAVFPLFLQADDGPRANFASAFLEALPHTFGAAAREAETRAVFGYIYALFHSPGYRLRFAEHLRIEFPRVFVPRDAELLLEMGELGERLIRIHARHWAEEASQPTAVDGRQNDADRAGSLRPRLLSKGESPRPKNPDSVAAGFPRFDGAAVQINSSLQFLPVPQQAWEWRVGGHQVCRKWLRDRKGRILTGDEVATYERIVQAATETQRMMDQIDRLIDRHGGWPDAFVAGRQSP